MTSQSLRVFGQRWPLDGRKLMFDISSLLTAWHACLHNISFRGGLFRARMFRCFHLPPLSTFRDCAIIIRTGGGQFGKWASCRKRWDNTPLLKGCPPPPNMSEILYDFLLTVHTHLCTSTLHFLFTHLWLKSYNRKQSSCYMCIFLTNGSGTNINSVAMFNKAIADRIFVVS